VIDPAAALGRSGRRSFFVSPVMTGRSMPAPPDGLLLRPHAADGLTTEERSAMTEDRIPMTREGYERKKAELDRMQGVEMLELTKRVAAARDLGDLSENAEYHAAREDQGILQAKINMLKDQLARAEILSMDNGPPKEIKFGARVKVMDLDMDEEETFELVGPGQENPDRNRILTSSPIAQGLLGKKKGEVAEIQVPRGTIRFKVLDIAAADLD
jgi:transcription elongation factor GreA